MFLTPANSFQQNNSPLTNGDFLRQSSGNIGQDRSHISNAMSQICALHPDQRVKAGICLTHLTGVRPQNQNQYPLGIFEPRCYLIMDGINPLSNECKILENHAMTVARSFGQCCNHNRSGGISKNPSNASVAVYVKLVRVGISQSDYEKRMQLFNDNQKHGLTPSLTGNSPAQRGFSPTHLGTAPSHLGTAPSQQPDFRRSIGSGLGKSTQSTQIHEKRINFDCCDTTFICRSGQNIEKLYTLSLGKKKKSIRLQFRCKECKKVTRSYSLAADDAKLTPTVTKAYRASSGRTARSGKISSGNINRFFTKKSDSEEDEDEESESEDDEEESESEDDEEESEKEDDETAVWQSKPEDWL